MFYVDFEHRGTYYICIWTQVSPIRLSLSNKHIIETDHLIYKIQLHIGNNDILMFHLTVYTNVPGKVILM